MVEKVYKVNARAEKKNTATQQSNSYLFFYIDQDSLVKTLVSYHIDFIQESPC